MFVPFLACLVLTGIHTYLGLHVVQRKVIFVDLALAQVAAFGATYGFILGYHPDDPQHGWVVYAFSLGFTFVGAAIFALTRMRYERVPQEAFIGIVYAVFSAGAILILAKSPQEAEHLKSMLVGNVLLVTPHTVLKTAAIYALVGVFHYVLRRQFLAISLDPEGAEHVGLKIRWWDFLFYMSFGFVITSSVAIAGVLLVFCYLVVPAAVSLLQRAQSDSVIEHAAKTLARLGDPAAVPPLLAAADRTSDSFLRLDIARAILELKDKRGLLVLIEILEREESPFIREEALRAVRQAAGQDFGYDAEASLSANAPALKRMREWRAKQPESASPR